MTFATAAEEYFTYENRLSSFQVAQSLPQRRASSASTKGPKSLKWPHKTLSPEDFAKAGFFYHPTLTNPDNVVCFLCHKALDSWEEGDDPLVEHLKLSSDCGWAIVASVEAQDGPLSYEYPLSEKMIEARKATFKDRWPHDAKKGWKCKTKQLVEAGWKYTPTPEYDDMATCAYCSLALDGWEPADKPMDEHHKRSPDCPFFTLVNDHKTVVKKPKGKRVSKVSRLSIQSAVTEAEELSMIDLPAHEEDSILTTATTATTGGRKVPKGKKATTANGRKTKAKKEEPEVIEQRSALAPEPEDDDFEVKVQAAPKATRGKKRKSDELQEASIATVETEAPPPKKRATRTRASTAVEDSVLEVAEVIKPKAKKGRASRAKKNSIASVVPMELDVSNDEEIEKELQADLERYASEDEAPAPQHKKKSARGSKIINEDHAMFGVADVPTDEAALEAELAEMEVAVVKPAPKAKGAPKGKTARKPSAKQQAAAVKKAAEEEEHRLAELQAEESVEGDSPSQQIQADLEQSMSIQHSSPVLQPKTQRATRTKSTKQPTSRTTRGSVMSVDDHNATMPGAFVDESRDDAGNETDASMASQATVVRGGASRRGSTLKKGKGTKKAPSRKIEEIIRPVETANAEAEESRPPHKGKGLLRADDTSMAEDFYTPAPEIPMETVEQEHFDMDAELEFEHPEFESTPARSPGRPQIQQTLTAMVENMSKSPVTIFSKSKLSKSKSPIIIARDPTPPPREQTASMSPQSSDAENHPPSSRPSLNKKTPTPLSHHKTATPRTTTRIPLAETDITRTPLHRISPSKHSNTISGLKSTDPWTPVDLEDFCRIENGLEEALKEGLSSPEKKMTVEEWIMFNAQRAEGRLKGECEGMVSVFERQGGKAMRALEGIEVLG